MIEKIFIVFVIMEGCGLILHIIDSIRCWTDRIYQRKQQNNVNDFNQKMYESREREEESIKTFASQVQYLGRFLDDKIEEYILALNDRNCVIKKV